MIEFPESGGSSEPVEPRQTPYDHPLRVPSRWSPRVPQASPIGLDNLASVQAAIHEEVQNGVAVGIVQPQEGKVGDPRRSTVKYDIVEIGPGYNPIVRQSASAITPDIRYLGISPSRLDEESFVRRYRKKGIEILDADFADLSELEDGSTDRVVMRSIFGEYTGLPEWTGSSIDNTRMGLFEAFRIIREGGEIVIAEENTPEGPALPNYTGAVLLDAGFTNVRVMPCQDMENLHWREVRGKYWNLVKDPPIDKRWGFVITAGRSAVDPEDFVPVERNILLKKVHQAIIAGEIDRDTPWSKTKTYQFKRPEAREGNSINIVTKDGSMDMETYLQGVRKRTIQPLFLD